MSWSDQYAGTAQGCLSGQQRYAGPIGSANGSLSWSPVRRPAGRALVSRRSPVPRPALDDDVGAAGEVDQLTIDLHGTGVNGDERDPIHAGLDTQPYCHRTQSHRHDPPPPSVSTSDNLEQTVIWTARAGDPSVLRHPRHVREDQTVIQRRPSRSILNGVKSANVRNKQMLGQSQRHATVQRVVDQHHPVE